MTTPEQIEDYIWIEEIFGDPCRELNDMAMRNLLDSIPINELLYSEDLKGLREDFGITPDRPYGYLGDTF